MDALEMISNLEQMEIKPIAVAALTENKEVMADMNATQMAQGKRATGTEINPQYHPLTVELKKGKGGLAGVTDRVTLFDTGSHYEKLYAEVKGDEIEYGSKDLKSEDLQEKYGAIYGLTEESREDFINGHLESTFFEKTHEELGL